MRTLGIQLDISLIVLVEVIRAHMYIRYFWLLLQLIDIAKQRLSLVTAMITGFTVCSAGRRALDTAPHSRQLANSDPVA